MLAPGFGLASRSFCWRTFAGRRASYNPPVTLSVKYSEFRGMKPKPASCRQLAPWFSCRLVRMRRPSRKSHPEGIAEIKRKAIALDECFVKAGLGMFGLDGGSAIVSRYGIVVRAETTNVFVF